MSVVYDTVPDDVCRTPLLAAPVPYAYSHPLVAKQLHNMLEVLLVLVHPIEGLLEKL